MPFNTLATDAVKWIIRLPENGQIVRDCFINLFHQLLLE